MLHNVPGDTNFFLFYAKADDMWTTRRHKKGTEGRVGIRIILIGACALITTGHVSAQSKTVGAPVSGGALDMGADLAGSPDPRATQWPGKVWGNAGYSDTVIQFYPPAGQRVHIISAVGTVSSYARGVVPSGTSAGISWGLLSNSGSSPTDAAVNNLCMAYVKQSITARVDSETTPFSFTGIGRNGVLAADNALVSRTAVYLNETGLTMHIEQALVLTYEFIDPASVAQVAQPARMEIVRPPRGSVLAILSPGYLLELATLWGPRISPTRPGF